jgi:hypothetical protein
MFDNAEAPHTLVLDKSIWKKLQPHEKTQSWKMTAQ